MCLEEQRVSKYYIKIAYYGCMTSKIRMNMQGIHYLLIEKIENNNVKYIGEYVLP